MRSVSKVAWGIVIFALTLIVLRLAWGIAGFDFFKKEVIEVNATPTHTVMPTLEPITPSPTQTPVITPSPTPNTSDFTNPYMVDYSFLDGVSTEYFPDAGEDGSWFPGKVERDTKTGEVTYVWDRHAETLQILDRYNSIYRKNTEDPKSIVYLTFDIAFETGAIDSILKTLETKQVKAIFFVTGQYIDENPDIIKRIYAEGHLLGNHTETHPNMSKLEHIEFVEQLNSVKNKIDRVLEINYDMKYYRPPEGICSERDLALANRMGYQTVFWSFAYRDYDLDAQPVPNEALNLMMARFHKGCVFLLHASSSTNAEILPHLINYIREAGFEIRRIDG
ncbi:MAG: polysaccharide deacetylase family protein [Clostridiales bacterium]|nr:polysaccharide deacetylase family protein [Clostridiales bacterium]